MLNHDSLFSKNHERVSNIEDISQWEQKSLYQRLGLPTSATEDEIKKAFRQLSQKYHPDKVSGIQDNKLSKNYEEIFKLIQVAYNSLSKGIENANDYQEKSQTRKLPYEFIDLSPIIKRDRLEKYYDAFDELKILKDALDVQWVCSGEKIGNIEEDGYWYAVLKKDNGVFLLYGIHSEASDEDLQTKNIENWFKINLGNVRAFSSTDALIKWLQNPKPDNFNDKEIKDRIIISLQKTAPVIEG